MKSHMQMIPETPSRASRLAQIHMFINNKIADGQNFEESLKEFEAEQKQTLMEHSKLVLIKHHNSLTIVYILNSSVSLPLLPLLQYKYMCDRLHLSNH